MTQWGKHAENWIAVAVRELNASGSWTGRIHIQKLLYLVQALKLANPPFDFELHGFGPYSFRLDEEIAQMELFDYLSRTYPKPGYGPKYTLKERGAEIGNRLSRDDATALQRVAKALGKRGSQALELLATCLWVEREESITDDSRIVERVQELKPKYNQAEVRVALNHERAIVSEFQPTGH